MAGIDIVHVPFRNAAGAMNALMANQAQLSVTVSTAARGLDYVVAPGRVFLAQRMADGAWRTLTYAQTLSRVRSVAQSLLQRRLSAERPIAILSGNDIEHALLGLAATMIGVPYAPISVPYSLMSSDFGKLKSIIEILTPGLVFDL